MRGMYMGDNAKLDNCTLMLLTVGSYVVRKLFGHKKAVPHRTEHGGSARTSYKLRNVL